MTRFARAKGSKSSNERVPDEATPWNVMKMQLEDSEASSQAVTKKAKSAKQLLEEKDEPFYYNTMGNVNHEWATFDDVLDSKSSKDKNGRHAKNQSSKTEKKKIETAVKLHTLNNGDSNKDLIVQLVTKVKKNKRNETQASEESETSKTIVNMKLKPKEQNKDIKNTVNEDVTEINSETHDTLSDVKSDSKSKKRIKKSKKIKATVDSGQPHNQSDNIVSESQQLQKDELASPNCDREENLSSKVEGNSEKLSKRQKRNQKKQKKIISEKNESSKALVDEGLQKEQGCKGFDVMGNDWSNEVKFGKERKMSTIVASNADNKVDNNKNLDKKMEKANKKKRKLEEGGGEDEIKNDKSISDDLKTQNDGDTVSRKNQKRKGGKNDNKEYKRRKPDEGVIKMIINGNEIEVVKYDGFPVKKEDADRLRELKKNMIIKGIPRSEINIAMKLERRKAEKALARERKRVCFHCRRSGHNLSDCPELGRDESGTGICFKCGSAEHTHFECKVIKGQEFRHASCFICREQGHIARQCPDNPKGLYPQGGGCKICGDVTHLKKDCPDLIKEKEETNITADKIIGSQLETLQENEAFVKNEIIDNKPRNKIIKF